MCRASKMIAGIVMLTVLLAGSTMAVTHCRDLHFDVLGQGAEWQLFFRGTANINVAVLPAYQHGTGLPTIVDPGCMQVGKPLSCFQHFRNDEVISRWPDVYEIMLAVYKGDELVNYVIFDGVGSDRMGWMKPNKVKTSSWTDLHLPPNQFSIRGQVTIDRRFMINHKHEGGCNHHEGWFMVLDLLATDCPYDRAAEPKPVIKYAKGTTVTNWNDATAADADYFAVLVKYDNTKIIMGL